MPEEKAAFLDEARIFVKAGDGGNGASSFRREKFVPLGGPDGGDGGSGGDVILCADPGVTTFRDFQHRRHFKAPRGGHGSGKKRHGKDGQDLTIKVPPGTVIYEDGQLLADLARAGECLVVARGGRGGFGNARYTSATNRAPRMAQRGEPGEERWVDLELKTIADVGLVGYPNVGKSSLLAAMTAARPKIGDYPFTTLSPNLGVARAAEIDLVVADIPGLIEGAHRGLGLGLRFLRHVERARVLLHVLDAAADDPVGDYERVREELRLFKTAMVDKSHLVAANKMDLAPARERWPAIRKACRSRGVAAVSVSAVTGEGIDTLLGELERILANLPAEQVETAPSVKVYRLDRDAERWTVERENSDFVVKGRRVDRLMAMTDVNNPEAVDRLQTTLERMGVFKALEEAGVQVGDTVRIGGVEMEWSEDLRA